ncbi:site-specific integrase [Rurimicrobium arvi]|uniref:Site-specific integrase n=1 Tax=Rurimicrobium arvi TaxID=2049916 RepID=A0ABP8N1W9_9BACT
MATVKIVLRARTNKDGTQPLAIRITQDRKASFIHLDKNIFAKDWDAIAGKVKKSHPNATQLNHFLAKKYWEAQEKSLEVETNKDEVTSVAVKQKIKPKGGKTFFSQADLYLKSLETAGKYNRFVADAPRVKHFREFLDGRDISFSDITVPLLKRFRAYLQGERKVKERTIINHLVVIRTVFNQAIQDGITDPKYYPFGKDKVSIKFPESIKIGLSAEDVRAIEALDYSDNGRLDHARNVWLLAFYFAGMRAADVLLLKKSDFKNNRLFYAMEKNDKGGSLKIPDKAQAIISKYTVRTANSEHNLLFPDLEAVPDLNDLYTVQRKTSYAVKNIDKALRSVAADAGIKHKLTMHIARHTFGNLSGDKIPIQMLQKLYRHSNVSTTIGYQSNFIHKDADEALDAVINTTN